MKTDRLALFLAVAGGVLALGACHRARSLTDAQLTQLLHTEAARTTGPMAPLDAAAVNCLRAWSGDAELTKALPPSSIDASAKTACRTRLDGWIGDATRNPDKFAFDDVSAPSTVRQAMALLGSHQSVMTRLPSATDRPPMGATGTPPAAATQNPAAPAVASEPTNPATPEEMAPAIAALDQLDTYCQRARDAAGEENADAMVKRYATDCDKRNAQLRARVMRGDANQMHMLTDRLQRTLTMVRQNAERIEQARNNKQ